MGLVKYVIRTMDFSYIIIYVPNVALIVKLAMVQAKIHAAVVLQIKCLLTVRISVWILVLLLITM